MRRLQVLRAALLNLLGGLCRFSPLVRRARLNEALIELAASEATGKRLIVERKAWEANARDAGDLANRRADAVERLRAKVVKLNAEKALAETEAARLGGQVAALEDRLARASRTFDVIADVIGVEGFIPTTVRGDEMPPYANIR